MARQAPDMAPTSFDLEFTIITTRRTLAWPQVRQYTNLPRMNIRPALAVDLFLASCIVSRRAPAGLQEPLAALALDQRDALERAGQSMKLKFECPWLLRISRQDT